MTFARCACAAAPAQVLLLVVLAGLAAATAETAGPVILYVDAVHGSDSNSGQTPAAALASIGACVERQCRGAAAAGVAGECLLLAGGVFRESVELDACGGRGLTVRAADAAQPARLSGTRLLQDVSWTPWATQPGVFVAELAAANLTAGVQQLFVDGEMMVEARWPNVRDRRNMMAREDWRNVSTGSRYGLIADPALAHFNFSWQGAQATLQVAHRFFTWTRTVNHSIGQGYLTYPQNLPGLAGWGNRTSGWDSSNMYILSGVLGALDSPGEFFFDAAAQRLYLWAPDGRSPAAHTVEVKQFDYVLHSSISVANVRLANLNISGGTLLLRCSSQCQLTNITLMHPSFSRNIPENDVPAGSSARTTILANDTTISGLVLAHTPGTGVQLVGQNLSVTDALVYDTDWFGTLIYPPVHVSGSVVFANSTVLGFGNAGIVTAGPVEVAHSVVAFGGLVGLDHAAIYTGGLNAAGCHWHHNWVYSHREKCLRGDDQSKNATIHHNVAFNCAQPVDDDNHMGYGLIIKGNGHVIYANTFFQSKTAEICIPNCVSL